MELKNWANFPVEGMNPIYGVLVTSFRKTPLKIPESCLMGVAQMDFYPLKVPILKHVVYRANSNGSYFRF